MKKEQPAEPAKTPPLVLAGRIVAVLIFAFLAISMLIALLKPDLGEYGTKSSTQTQPPIRDYTDAVAKLNAANDTATAAYKRWYDECTAASKDGLLSPTEEAAASQNLDDLKGKLSTFGQRLDEYAAILPAYQERLGENAAIAMERIPELVSSIENMDLAAQDCTTGPVEATGTPTAAPTPTASPTPRVKETVTLKVNVIGSGNGYVYSGDVIKCEGDCNATDRFSDYTTYFQCLGSCTFTFERSENTYSLAVGNIKGTKTTFQEWGGDCSGDSGSCWLLMDSNKEITAAFTRREVVIESYTCTFRGMYGDSYDYFVSASGTASGLVGAALYEGTLPNFEQFTCPSWTGVQQGVWPYRCARGSGDPERTSFTVSLTFRGNKGPPFTLSKNKWLIHMGEPGGYLVTGSDNTDIVCN